mgnify:CR=1 FL=1
MIINNGGGGVKADAKVNPDNALKTYGVTKSEARKAAIDGNSYNISTGLIAYTGNADEGLLYFKNDEVASVLVEAITFGVGLVSATLRRAPSSVLHLRRQSLIETSVLRLP